MNNGVLVLQPFGLGDCIFTQTLVMNLFWDDNRPVFWPVQVKYLNDLKRAYPSIIWVPENLCMLDAPTREDILAAQVVPIRWSDTFCGMPYKYVMRAKYLMYGENWETWMDRAMWHRDAEREVALFKSLGLEIDKPYCLVSELFTGEFKRHQLKIETGTPVVQLIPIPGYSLFDWAMVIEHATEIHFVASSNIYLLELLNLRAQLVHIYPRKPDQPHHKFYDYILRRHNYFLH